MKKLPKLPDLPVLESFSDLKKLPKLPDLPEKPEPSDGTEGPTPAYRELRKPFPIRGGGEVPELPEVPVDSDGGAYLDIIVLASLLRDRRRELGLSQEALADHVHGLDRATVANWEAGLYLAGHVVLLRTLDVLGIELRRIPAHCLKSNTRVFPSP